MNVFILCFLLFVCMSMLYLFFGVCIFFSVGFGCFVFFG